MLLMISLYFKIQLYYYVIILSFFILIPLPLFINIDFFSMAENSSLLNGRYSGLTKIGSGTYGMSNYIFKAFF